MHFDYDRTETEDATPRAPAHHPSRNARVASSANRSPLYANVPAVRMGGHMHAPGKCAGCSLTGGKCGSCEAGAQLYESLPRRGHIPSNTVHCLQRWTPCRAPYSPGSWAAKVSYHCPRIIRPLGIILPGTTMNAYVTIPDEYIGTNPSGTDMYRCRPKPQTRLWLEVGDTAATVLTRSQLYQGQATCHAGFRANLESILGALFAPSGGGRPWGGRVNAPPPPSGIPCP